MSIARMLRVATTLAVLALTSGCATVIKGTTQSVPISSDPPGAEILVDGQYVGTTPSDVELKRKRDHLVVVQKKDFAPRSVPVVKNVGGAVWGNIIAGGLIGWGVDAASGAQNNLSPKTIFVKLEPAEDSGDRQPSGADSSAGIRRLNELDQMREDDRISDEEYTRARVAIISEYFPEMVPKNQGTDSESDRN